MNRKEMGIDYCIVIAELSIAIDALFTSKRYLIKLQQSELADTLTEEIKALRSTKTELEKWRKEL